VLLKDSAKRGCIEQTFSSGFQLIGRGLGQKLAGFGGQHAEAFTQLALQHCMQTLLQAFIAQGAFP